MCVVSSSACVSCFVQHQQPITITPKIMAEARSFAVFHFYHLSLQYMKEVYWEIKINNLSGPRQAKLRQKSGPRFVYFDLPIYFLHGYNPLCFSGTGYTTTKSSVLYETRIIIHISISSVSHQLILQDLTPIKIPTQPYFQSNCNKI